jgi:DNA-binding MarR family transcriptional regulator
MLLPFEELISSLTLRPPSAGGRGVRITSPRRATRSYRDVIVERVVSLPDAAYARLLALRTGLRLFERWSAEQARAARLTPAHHQLLLAIRGHDHPDGPTIGEVADYLLLRHHSAVGLADRAESAGLVRRVRSEEDRRVVRLQLTEEGAARLEALSALHLEELERLEFDLPRAWLGLAPVQRPHGFPGVPMNAVGRP